MPFDPTLPLENSEMKSAEMRDQFNGLKDLIDAIPPAPPETDPVFEASEAHLFQPGDKAKLDAAATQTYVDTRTGVYAEPSWDFVTPRQPSVAHDILVIAQVDLNSGDPGSEARVTALVEASNPPTLQAASAYVSTDAGGVYVGQTLTVVVPKAQWYKFVIVGDAGVSVLREFPVNL